MPVRINKKFGSLRAMPSLNNNHNKRFINSAAMPWMIDEIETERYTFYQYDENNQSWYPLPQLKMESFLKLSGNALHVLEKRYLRKDDKGNIIETPEEMFRRVAQTIASAEILYNQSANPKVMENKFYRIMTNLEFLPNSPTLLNAGLKSGQLFCCYVLSVEDTLKGIFENLKETALIHKSGGGTGFSFSQIRPERDSVGIRDSVAGGPVSLIGLFSNAAQYVRQGGVRCGCNSVAVDVTHPDIVKFIMAKDDPSNYPNFYISIVVNDSFMEAVENNTDYELINPRNSKITEKLNAKYIFDKLVEQAWKTGDPGIIFKDRVNKDNPTPDLGQLEVISGCGEQVLRPYESSNLGSINMVKMLHRKEGVVEIDYRKLKRVAKLAIRFMDNAIDVNNYPIPRAKEEALRTRKLGLGIMGFADMLIQMGIPYDSPQALKLAEQIMETVQQTAHQASRELAEERGVFPAFKGSIYDKEGGKLMRNATCTTIAPTGTLSLIAGVSGGIEPSFAMVFVRNILDGEQMLEVNPYFEKIAKKEKFFSEELLKQMVSNNRLQGIDSVPDNIKEVFVTAHRITPEGHIKMQAAFQKHVDNAVSKTVNFPKSAKKEDMAKVFIMAHKEGLKGITVYRDDSRELQPLSTGEMGLEMVCEYACRQDK
jgi:ribonucleoside-diphosphate reductase alpha chain